MTLPQSFSEDKNYINAVIETPCGSTIKYKYDKEGDYFKLDKYLPSGICFPVDFGFIPGTKGEDGDPLDIIVLSDFPLAVGAVAECRLIGVFKVEQKEKGTKFYRNDRFVGIPAVSKKYEGINSIDEVGKNFADGLTSFFEHYNEMQDKEFKLLKIK